MSMNVTMVFFPRVYFEFNSLFNCYVSISWNLCFISFAIFIISRVLFWDWSSVRWLLKNITHFNFDRLYGWYISILHTLSLIISAIVTSLSRAFWDSPSLSFLVTRTLWFCSSLQFLRYCLVHYEFDSLCACYFSFLRSFSLIVFAIVKY